MNENDDEILTAALLAKASRLPAAVTPERDLWPGVQAAISRPAQAQRSVWKSVWAQAAAVFLMVGASSAVTYTVVKGDDPAFVPLAELGTELNFKPVSGSFGSQYNLGPEYQDVRRDLDANLEAELENLHPETRAAVEENIATIRQAIEEINVQLAEAPDNVLLQELLLRTYRDELSLMKKIDEISHATMRRDDI